MAVLTRARGMALAGVTALAVTLPISPGAAGAGCVGGSRPPRLGPVAGRSGGPGGGAQAEVVAVRPLVRGPRLVGDAHRQLAQGRAVSVRRIDPARVRLLGVHVVRVPQGRRPAAALGLGPADKARRISRANARPGDLVFFRNGSGVYHVGIYAGHNRTLHSPRPGRSVTTARIWSGDVSFGRVL